MHQLFGLQAEAGQQTTAFCHGRQHTQDTLAWLDVETSNKYTAFLTLFTYNGQVFYTGGTTDKSMRAKQCWRQLTWYKCWMTLGELTATWFPKETFSIVSLDSILISP